ncbi:hypothetical protein GC163_05775 [bacterium]|nr:hypothetical protein [bacterium]
MRGLVSIFGVRAFRLLLAGWCLLGLVPRVVFAADLDVSVELQQKIDQSLARGVAWLKQRPFRHGTGEGSLVGYALLKAKVQPDAPDIIRHRDSILRRIQDGYYTDMPGVVSIINYEAGCDAMFLESLDAPSYQEQLTKLRDFLISRQLEAGGWYYPAVPVGATGDTSITQYAILGLWAIHRAGIDVPRDVWARCAKYLSTTQRGEGGFSYHPHEIQNADHSRSTASMTAAGYGTALITQLLLFGPDAAPQESANALPRKRFGVLEQLPDKEEEAKKIAARQAADKVSVSRETFKKMLPSAEAAVSRFFEDGLRGPHPIYFLYGCERAGAISGHKEFGAVNWYETGVDFLLKRQAADGSWDISGNYSAEVDTSFAILFLSRATKTLVPRPKKRLVAGGLLVGGRGLPDELDTVSVSGGELKPHVPKGDVDQLLAALEQPSEVNLPEVAQALIESVSLEKPDELIGNLPRLQQLVRHPDAEVRQVAVWALSRSGDIRQVPLLIATLDDPDLYVAWEASMGLCVVSRLPLGVTRAGDAEPLPIAPPGVQDDNPDPAQGAGWRTKQKAAWDAWYQRVRPYDERDNRRQIRPK